MTPSVADLSELVPLIASVYDLRLLLTLVSVSEFETSDRTPVLTSAFNHVAENKLMLDDHTCAFFKLALDQCKTNAWLSRHDVLLLDRRAEKANTESTTWVAELQRQVYVNNWRLDAHDRCLRVVVDGIRETHEAVVANRAVIRAVYARVVADRRVLEQVVSRGDEVAGVVDQLQQRLTQSEENVMALATSLQQFRTAYVSRLEQEEKAKAKKRKMVCGLLAATVGFVFAPALKQLFDAAINLANPVEVHSHAFTEKDIVKFLADKSAACVLTPVVQSALEELAIPTKEFESVLREALVLTHPEYIDHAEARGLVIEDGVGEEVTNAVRKLELSLGRKPTSCERS